MRNTLLLLSLFTFPAFSAYAQVNINKPINLSGTATGSAKIAGIKDVDDAQDALSVEAMQKGSFIYAGTSGGSGSAYTVSLTPAISGYTAGMVLYFKAHAASAAGGVTIDVNSKGTRSIKKNGNQNPAANDIVANQLVCVIYDGANFHLVSQTSDNNFVQNQTANDQSAGFRITGDGLFNGGKVGIGTASPQGQLQIKAPSSYDGSTQLFLTNNATDYGRTNLVLTGRIQAANDGWAFGSDARNSIVFAQNAGTSGNNTGLVGTEQYSMQLEGVSNSLGFLSKTKLNVPILTMLQNGNIGINTTSPTAKLEVKEGNIKFTNSNSPFSAGLYHTNSIYMADNQYLDISTGTYKAASTGTSNRLQIDYNNGFRFINSPSVATDVAVTSNEAMRITNAGWVGIGTTAPAGQLQIKGPADFDGSTRFYLTNNNNDYGRTNFVITGRIQAGNDAWSFGSGARNSIVFAANAGTSGANVGAVGTEQYSIQLEGNSNSLGFLSKTNAGTPVMTLSQAGNVDVSGAQTNKNAGCVIQGNNWSVNASGTSYGTGTWFIANTYTATGTFGDARLVNQGGAFNATNNVSAGGVFTAPQSGFYLLTFRLISVTNGQRILLGGSLNGAYATEIYDKLSTNPCGGSSSCEDENYSMIIYLNAGDTHRVVRHSASGALGDIIIAYRLFG